MILKKGTFSRKGTLEIISNLSLMQFLSSSSAIVKNVDLFNAKNVQSLPQTTVLILKKIEIK